MTNRIKKKIEQGIIKRIDDCPDCNGCGRDICHDDNGDPVLDANENIVTTRCKTCHGHGIVFNWDFSKNGNDIATQEAIYCPRCYGDGELMVINNSGTILNINENKYYKIPYPHCGGTGIR